MKASSCRAVALHMGRLRVSPFVQQSRRMIAATTATPTTVDGSNSMVTTRTATAASTTTASTGSKPACSFSTAVRKVSYEEEEHNHNNNNNNSNHNNECAAALAARHVLHHDNNHPANNKNVFRKSRNLLINNNNTMSNLHNTTTTTTTTANQVMDNIIKSYHEQQRKEQDQNVSECTCGMQRKKDVQQDNEEPLPPPLPEPIYSVHKRVLPPNLIALSSPRGRQYLIQSLTQNTAESYWALSEQFINQGDPAFCGVTTLLMVLNAMNVDPNVKWKGGWRFYGDENVLLHRCCLNAERIRRIGITMEQFLILGTCHGMRITMKRPPAVADGSMTNIDTVDNDSQQQQQQQQQQYHTLEEFRNDIRQTLDSRYNKQNSMLVVSFSRAALQQTGDGHFSPIAAYHEESDQVLILDVARFKYAPYWVRVEDLYKSMQPLDEATKLPRGWYVMKPPCNNSSGSWGADASHYYHEMTSEDRRPAHLVPQANQAAPCPVGKIKVEFCPAKSNPSINGEGVKSPRELN